MAKPIVNIVTELKDPDYHLAIFQVSSSIVSVNYNLIIDTFSLYSLISYILYLFYADVTEDPTRTKPVDHTGKIWNIHLLSSNLHDFIHLIIEVLI